MTMSLLHRLRPFGRRRSGRVARPPVPAEEPDAGQGTRFALLATACLFVVLFGLALARAHHLEGGYDFGYFRQAAWLIAHGRAPFVTLRGLYLLGDHASPIFYVMALPTRFLPPIPTFVAMQSLALAVGIVPLHRIARELARLSRWPTIALLVAYGLYPAMQNVNLADFHPEAVAVPALIGAAYFGLTRRWWPYGLCVVVALACREDMAIAIFSLGLLLLVERLKWPGLATMAVGAAVWIIDTRVVQPHYAGQFVQAALLAHYGHNVGQIVENMVLNPDRVARDLFTARNLNYAIALLAPVLLLPLLAPRYLIPALPLQALYLISGRPEAHTIVNQYTVVSIAFVFVAAAMGLGRLERVSPEACALGARALVVSTLVFNASLSVGIHRLRAEARSGVAHEPSALHQLARARRGRSRPDEPAPASRAG